MRRIVLTGGPGAGKTTILQALCAAHPDLVAGVPEAATQVYHMLRTRWALLDIAGRRDLQRRIYRLQLDQESRIATANPSRLLLLDRGTIDGASYWPDGPDTYWPAMGTTMRAELARYDGVIFLQTVAARGGYDRSTNPVRHETAQGAIERSDALEALWATHPRLVRIDAQPTIDQKIDAARRAITELADFPLPLAPARVQ